MLFVVFRFVHYCVNNEYEPDETGCRSKLYSSETENIRFKVCLCRAWATHENESQYYCCNANGQQNVVRFLECKS